MTAGTKGLRVLGSRAAEIFADPGSTVLFAEYERECANPLIGAIAPQREIYEAMESAGVAQCFAAYVDGVLCGYACVVMAVLPHYGKKCATVESLFVARAARGCGLGPYLMDAVENHCREAGCIALIYTAPVRSRLARLLFLSEDRYTNTGHTFYRSLV